MPKQANRALRTNVNQKCRESPSVGPLPKLAATRFRRWKGSVPSDAIAKQMDRCEASATMAYGVMLKSREQLIAMHGDHSHALVEQFTQDLETSAEVLEKLAEMIREASMRIYASAAARLVRGQPFAD
ncbi:MAG: hypothetical protein JSR89_18335 [Proteobacteria bacterium]|nr:hypothetical protein [Pseudomonadota bacterium]